MVVIQDLWRIIILENQEKIFRSWQGLVRNHCKGSDQMIFRKVFEFKSSLPCHCTIVFHLLWSIHLNKRGSPDLPLFVTTKMIAVTSIFHPVFSINYFDFKMLSKCGRALFVSLKKNKMTLLKRVQLVLFFLSLSSRVCNWKSCEQWNSEFAHLFWGDEKWLWKSNLAI